MSTWQEDKRVSDRYLPEIKQILGLHLIGEPPVEEDQERNTDLIVLKMEAVRVGCRVRRHAYLERYGDEFTIRAKRPRSGHKTELAKIVEGWGDYFFYGFSDEDEVALSQWTLCDLNVFRVWHSRQLFMLPSGTQPGKSQNNPDGSSGFQVFRFSALPSRFVVAAKQAARQVAQEVLPF